jgi:hypothetical protein
MIRRFLQAGVVLTVCAFAGLAIAAPAVASSTPTYSMYSPFCQGWTTPRQMIPQFGILAADRYSYYGETQRVYVRGRAYNYTRGAWSDPSDWFYGTATDFAGPQTWTNLRTGEVSGNANWSPIIFTVFASGTYQVALQFAWDVSSSGAPAGSTSYLWEPGVCTF